MHQYKRLMKWLDELRWNNLQAKLDKKQSPKQYVTYVIIWLKTGRGGFVSIYCLYVHTIFL